MLTKSLKNSWYFLIAISLLVWSNFPAGAQTQSFTYKTHQGANAPANLIGTIFSQPVDPDGQLLLSAWLDPDGSDYDQYIWDNFTLPSDGTITEIDWFGVYDPLKFGNGGPVLDFSVSIYPSNISGTEPAVAGPPLVEYQTGGNAGETAIGTAGGGTLYAYALSLPAPFMASAGVKYWVQIEAFQQGTVPDWCLAAGWGGNGSHFRRTSGAGGDIMYRIAPGDAAFTLLGPIPDIPTPTDTATGTPTDTATATLTNTATYTASATSTSTSTNTATNTATYTPTDTSTATQTNTATNTSTATATDTATNTPTATATNTLQPVSNTPGKVTGGGTIGSTKNSGKATFGFEISFKQGDLTPKGKLTYQDRTFHVRLKATSFDLLVIDGNHAWFTGTGTLSNGQVVSFIVDVVVRTKHSKLAIFKIYIPALNGYAAGGAVTGGNITIHR